METNTCAGRKVKTYVPTLQDLVSAMLRKTTKYVATGGLLPCFIAPRAAIVQHIFHK